MGLFYFQSALIEDCQ